MSIQRSYAVAQKTYIDAWETYHTAYTIQPPEIQAEWVKDYHPLFLKAGKALQAWSGDLSSVTMASDANAAIDQLTVILLQIKR